MARHGENIHKRKDGRWEGRYIKGRYENGTARWGYVYGNGYTEVRELLIRKKAQAGFYQLCGTSMTFAELSEAWLCSISNGLKESTLAHYHYTLHKYLLPVLGSLTINTLSEAILEPALLHIFDGAGSHRPLGTISARECLGIVRRVCRYAAHLRLVRPLDICVKIPDRNRPAQQPLSSEKQQKLQAFLLQNPTPRKIGILLGMQLGLRIGEICGLQWGDFDLKHGILSIQRTVCRISCGNGHTKVVIQPPKTRTSKREIPIPKHLLAALQKLKENFSSNTWFLSGTAEKPVEPRCYRKSIKAYLKQAMVEQIRPHTLRHTFATTCMQKGCDIKTLSELLGHAHADITLRQYVHSDLSRKRREINRIYSDRTVVKSSQYIK